MLGNFYVIIADIYEPFTMKQALSFFIIDSFNLLYDNPGSTRTYLHFTDVETEA